MTDRDPRGRKAASQTPAALSRNEKRRLDYALNYNHYKLKKMGLPAPERKQP